MTQSNGKLSSGAAVAFRVENVLRLNGHQEHDTELLYGAPALTFTLAGGGALCFAVSIHDKRSLRKFVRHHKLPLVVPGGTGIPSQLRCIGNLVDDDVCCLYVGENDADRDRASLAGFKYLQVEEDETINHLYDRIMAELTV